MDSAISRLRDELLWCLFCVEMSLAAVLVVGGIVVWILASKPEAQRG